MQQIEHGLWQYIYIYTYIYILYQAPQLSLNRFCLQPFISAGGFLHSCYTFHLGPAWLLYPAPALLALRPARPAHWPFAALRAGGFPLCLFCMGGRSHFTSTLPCAPHGCQGFLDIPQGAESGPAGKCDRGSEKQSWGNSFL